MKVENIIPEIHTLTTGIYYKEFQKLIDCVLNIPVMYRKNYWIICRESVSLECKRIGDFFNVKTMKTHMLPNQYLIICVNYRRLRRDMEWL